MSLLLIGQVLGILSFFIGVYTFTHKSDHRLKLTMALLFLCQTAHFFCMGSTTGMLVNFVSFVRTLVAIRFNSKWVGIGFICGNLVLGVPNVDELIDILPIVAASIGTFAIFFLSGIHMRLAFMLGAVLWLVNNFYIGSIGGVLLEGMVLIANLITIYRLHKQPLTPQT